MNSDVTGDCWDFQEETSLVLSELCQEWERGGPGFGKGAVAAASFLIEDDSLASGVLS